MNGIGASEIRAGETFRDVLRELRLARRLAQSRLAIEADCDHSYVSRIESGARLPQREIVERFVAALGLSLAEADRLRVAAGFAPQALSLPALLDPLLLELAEALTDDGLAPLRRARLREAVLIVLEMARAA